MESGESDKTKRLKRRHSQPLVAGKHKAPRRIPVLVVVTTATVGEPLKVSVFAPAKYRVDVYVEGAMSNAQTARWLEAFLAFQRNQAARYQKEVECEGCRQWRAWAERWAEAHAVDTQTQAPKT